MPEMAGYRAIIEATERAIAEQFGLTVTYRYRRGLVGAPAVACVP
jgi:hypothetical protein